MRVCTASLGVSVAIVSGVTLLGLSGSSPAVPATNNSVPPASAPALEIPLPPPMTAGGMSLTEALARRRTVRTFQNRPLDRQQVSQLCWAAQGITEPQRGLRTAPSALGLFPIHVFIVEHAGLFEYLPASHALVRRLDGDALGVLQKTMGQGPVTAAPCCMIICMDVARLEPRCHDRSERYCLLEAGHVAQNVLLQATAAGLSSVPVGGIDEARITAVLPLPTGWRPVYLVPLG
jgi:SagB-type dehydrogenase family enzyme